MEVKKDVHKDVLELQEVKFQEQHQEIIDQATELHIKPTAGNTESLLNSTSDIESGKETGMEEKGCLSEKTKRIWLPIAALIILLIIVLVAIGCTLRTGNPDTEQDVIHTTHRYRLPHTNFDDCCGGEEKKRTYLEACTEKFKDDDIQCIFVTRGSAIITTQSTNPNHKEIVNKKLGELTSILNHSVKEAYYNGEKEEKEEKEKKEKKQKQAEIKDLKSKVDSLQTKLEDQKKKIEELREDAKNKELVNSENEKKIALINEKNQKIADQENMIDELLKDMKIKEDLISEMHVEEVKNKQLREESSKKDKTINDLRIDVQKLQNIIEEKNTAEEKRLTEIVPARSQTLLFENTSENDKQRSLTDVNPVTTKNLKKIYKQMKDLLDKDRRRKATKELEKEQKKLKEEQEIQDNEENSEGLNNGHSDDNLNSK